ncbi:MAG: response regulator [Myxococcales bacterium]|nr:response regulator [Myxococcales bacterium]
MAHPPSDADPPPKPRAARSKISHVSLTSLSTSGLLRRPVFADPVVQWQADLVYPVCWISLLAMLLSTAASVVYAGSPTVASWATIALVVPILVAMQLTRAGRIRAGAWVLSLSIFGLITAAALWFAEVAHVAHLYAIAILIAGLVLGGEALVALSVLGVGLVVSLVLAEASGWLPPPLHADGFSNSLITLVMGVLVAAIIVSRAVASTRRARVAWRKASAELQTVLSTLEQTVEERTAELRAANVRLREQAHARSLIQADLVAARDQAQAAVEAKARFVANVSHELRTPLNGIIGVADLLAHERLPPSALRHVDTIRTSGELMVRLVGDVLDFSRLEAERLELEEIDFSLAKIIDAVVAPFDVAARRRDLVLRVELDERLPRRLRGDPGRLSQVLTNLVGNAVKFTTEGSVTVKVALVEAEPDARDEPEPEPDERFVVRFAVTDTGLGMSPEAAQRVFEPFVQGDSSTTRRYGGTGLGLTICKQLAEHMGGEIGVSSRLGQGSTFELVLPFAAAKTHQSEEQEPLWAPAPASAALEVLVVEDNEINQRVAQAMLARLGHRYTVVSDGEAALRELVCTPFDVVLMDCQMPGMDGLEACRRLRAAEGPNRRVPVVALTAHDSKTQREATRAAGMDAFLAKPVRLEALAGLLAEIEPARAAALGSGAAVEPPETELDERALGELRALESVRAGLLAKMARLYLEQAPGRIEAIAGAEEPSARAEAAHTLKGSSVSLGARSVGKAAAAIEEAARAGRDTDALVPALREAYAAIVPAIEALG